MGVHERLPLPPRLGVSGPIVCSCSEFPLHPFPCAVPSVCNTVRARVDTFLCLKIGVSGSSCNTGDGTMFGYSRNTNNNTHTGTIADTLAVLITTYTLVLWPSRVREGDRG